MYACVPAPARPESKSTRRAHLARLVRLEEVVEPGEGSRVVQRSCSLFTMVSAALGGGELNERLGAAQGVDELRGGGADVVLLGVAVSCWPVRGRTVEEWMPVAGRYAGELLLGRRSAVLDRRAPGSSARAPGPLAALQVQEIEGSGVNGALRKKS